MMLSSGLRRLASLAALVASLGGCQAIVPGADDVKGTPCFVEGGIGTKGGCEDGEYCLGHTCLRCPDGQSCITGSAGGNGGDAGTSDEGGAGPGGADAGGTSAGGNAGKGGVSGKGGAGNQAGDGGAGGDAGDGGDAGSSGDGPGGGADGGTAGVSAGGTDGGASGQGGTVAGMSGGSGQSGTAGTSAGTAGTTGGSAGSTTAPPPKLGDVCAQGNLCVDSSLCINLGAWKFGPTTEYRCTTPCCQSSDCGDPANKLVCMPTTLGGGMCLPSSFTSGRSSTFGSKNGGEACTASSECRSGSCIGDICRDLCCALSSCQSSANECSVSKVSDSTIDAFQCVPKPATGAPGSDCSKNGLGDDSKCASGICVYQIDVINGTGWKCGQPCQQPGDCKGIYSCDYATSLNHSQHVRVCVAAGIGGACASNKNCTNGRTCDLDSDELLVCQ